MRDCKNYTGIIIIVLVLVSLITFSRIAANDFVDFDEIAYLTENLHVQSGINTDSVKWAFTTTHFGYWHPLTWMSHMLDWKMFGANASGHHLVSLFLHVCTIIFLFLFLNKTTNALWPSAFVAAFFSLHPLRVESVAWAAERKDVLSMFFGMASILAYSFYSESTKLSRYLLCLILFIFSLMSKPLLVTLPFVLMLLDYWPLKRWQKAMASESKGLPSVGGLILEKVPLVLLSIVFSIVVFWTQNKTGAMSSLEVLSFPDRAINAICSYIAYMGKIFWPVNLAVFYPYEFSFPLWKVLVSVIIFCIITVAVIYYIKKLPFLFVGWFWYLGSLIPLIGLVQVGQQAMADRHTYLPSIGVAIMLAWGIPSLIKRDDLRKKILFPVSLIVVALLSVLTWRQCGYWKNSGTLFSHALQITNRNYLAHNNLAVYMNKQGNVKGAIHHSNEAIRIKPDYPEAYNNRGFAFTKLGQYRLAIDDFNKSILLKPVYADAYNNRGICHYETGQYQRAIEDYNEAIRLKPDHADAYYNRGNVYANAKPDQCRRAIEDYNQAIRLKPFYADAYNNRGICFDATGQYKRAIKDYNEAIRMRPGFADAYHNRAFVFFNTGHIKPGCNDAQKACELGSCRLLETVKGKGYCR